MPDHPMHNNERRQLDPNALSAPFAVRTKWHVITGAPCCGKTTLIEQLADQGFRLGLQRNGVRTEDDATAGFLSQWLAPDYGALGYSVVRVPVLAPEERLAFVLERLSEQGLMS